MDIFQLILVVLCLTNTFGEVRNPLPQNKAVLTGTARVVLNCTSTLGALFISWRFTSVGNTSGASVTNGNYLYTYFKCCYEISSTGDSDNNLIIKVVNESLAGTYTCTDDGYASYATSEVIVVKSDPVCTANVSSTAILRAGQKLQMSCSFSYVATSPIVSVSMIWSNDSKSPVESPVPLTTVNGVVTTATSTITQVVGYSSPFPVHLCQTSFKLNASNVQAATNQPDYMNTLQPFPSPIQVYYFVPSCAITGTHSDGRIYQGTSIECKAVANPPANYTWLHIPSGTVTRSSTIPIWKDGEYQCMAWNSVGNCAVSVNLTTLPGMQHSVTNDYTEEKRNIAVGVVVGVSGAILIVIIIMIIFWRIRKNSRQNNSKLDDVILAGNVQNQSCTEGSYEALSDVQGHNVQLYEQLQENTNRTERTTEGQTKSQHDEVEFAGNSRNQSHVEGSYEALRAVQGQNVQLYEQLQETANHSEQTIENGVYQSDYEIKFIK